MDTDTPALDTTVDTPIPKVWVKMGTRKPRGVKMGSRVQTMKESAAARTKGDRRVEEGCVDISKQEAWYARKTSFKKWEIVPLKSFILEHDFQRDKRYLELTTKLTYFDIELAKHVAMGDTVSEILTGMFEDGHDIRKWVLANKIARREHLIEPLVEYYRELLGQARNPDTFSVAEAFRNLVSSVRHQALTPKERFDLTTKLVDLCGMGSALKTYGASRITGKAAEAPTLTLDDARTMADA